MKFKKAASLILVGALLTASFPIMTGCSSKDELGAKMFSFGGDYYKSVSERHKLNYDEMVYDDFTNGIDLNRWVISDSVWDQWDTDQNGVRPQNVFLVDDKDNPDTHLLLRANGSYYNMDYDALYTEEEKAQYGNNKKDLFTASQGYGINSAACISSIEAFGPGRYDIKMKPCPRVGALTSMWVYSWFTLDDGSTQQNEIDIEIGLQPDFSSVFYTTWTSPSNNTNMPTPVDYYVNDGDWHIYSFDWVTDTKVPYVDYFIDGKKVLTIDANVPTTNATLNIGMWVPSWSGGGITDPEKDYVSVDSRMFDSDYAEISWWRYIPFEMDGWEQRPVQNRNYADGYVPKTLTSLPTANKCANGDFERDDYGVYGNPWKDFTITDEDNDFYIENSSAEVFIESLAEGSNACAKIVNGGMLGQWLRGASSGFKYRLTGKYRTENGATAALRYTYVTGYALESGTNGNKTMDIGESAEWKDFTLDFTIDKDDIMSIRYYLMNSEGKGTCYFDDLTLTYMGH